MTVNFFFTLHEFMMKNDHDVRCVCACTKIRDEPRVSSSFFLLSKYILQYTVLNLFTWQDAKNFVHFNISRVGRMCNSDNSAPSATTVKWIWNTYVLNFSDLVFFSTAFLLLLLRVVTGKENVTWVFDGCKVSWDVRFTGLTKVLRKLHFL